MLYKYVCIDCLSKLADEDYKTAIDEIAINVDHRVGEQPRLVCLECDGSNFKKVLGMSQAYVRGYGYTDKAGMSNDMNLHNMTTGTDPYNAHRQIGEKRSVVKRLRGNQSKDAQKRDIHV